MQNGQTNERAPRNRRSGRHNKRQGNLCTDGRMGRLAMTKENDAVAANVRKFYRHGCELAEKPYKYTMSGLDDVYLMNGFTLKETDYGHGVTISDVNGLHRAIGLSLVTDRKVLSPKELRFLRREMDLTQAEMGSKIGQSSQQVARWEKGACEIPGPAERLIRVLYVVSLVPAKQRSVFLNNLFKQLDALTKTDETSSPPLVFKETDDGWEKAIAA